VIPLPAEEHGYFGRTVSGVTAGDRYRYTVGGQGPFPDPVSRYQPEGVHGPSEVVDPSRFAWTDHHWRGVPPESLVLYELHVGTFTPEGTFRAIIERLPWLRDLGVTAIQLMPVADFPGARNWGYDGAALFAPARCYGTPDDLRAFVDSSHRHGLGVLLDVVYNHVGPDGAYLFAFSPWYFTDRHPSPWGKSVNLDGPHAREVRAFLIENALHWIHEYHFDGLRLDATHAMRDDGERPFLAELSARVHASVRGRLVAVIAEDDRNLSHMVRPASAGGLGLDGVWADDFHHQVRRSLAGDSDGYYMDYSGTATDIATTIRQGWFYTGQHSRYAERPRGTDPAGIAPRRFVVCLQNHDQIGTGAQERLTGLMPCGGHVLPLTLPQTPLVSRARSGHRRLFLYFTDHHDEPPAGHRGTTANSTDLPLGSGRTDSIPPPVHVRRSAAVGGTHHEPHAGMVRRIAPCSYSANETRRLGSEARFSPRRCTTTLWCCCAVGGGDDRPPCGLGSGTLTLPKWFRAAGSWRVLLTSESADFTTDPKPPDVDLSGPSPVLRFGGPAAVILARAVPSE
jgi:maltooligosyltrehalose trehalohydrolase